MRRSLAVTGALALLAFAAIPAPAQAMAPGSDCLILAAAGDSMIALGALFDSTEAWPSSRSSRVAQAIERGLLQHLPYMFEHKGDYLRATIYPPRAGGWALDLETRVVLEYDGELVESLEIILLSYEEGTMDFAKRILSSRETVVVDTAGVGLFATESGGYRGFVRFPAGSLPRSSGGFQWFGGSKWGVEAPNSARVERGG